MRCMLSVVSSCRTFFLIFSSHPPPESSVYAPADASSRLPLRMPWHRKLSILCTAFAVVVTNGAPGLRDWISRITTIVINYPSHTSLKSRNDHWIQNEAARVSQCRVMRRELGGVQPSLQQRWFLEYNLLEHASRIVFHLKLHLTW